MIPNHVLRHDCDYLMLSPYLEIPAPCRLAEHLLVLVPYVRPCLAVDGHAGRDAEAAAYLPA